MSLDSERIMARAELAGLRAREIQMEAADCTDLDRLRVLRAELKVILASLVEIRREQLMELAAPKPKGRRRRLFGLRGGESRG